jgi:hypothetical protein
MTNTKPQLVHIRRRFAVWNEDCIETILPADIDPTDRDTIDAWAQENYDALVKKAVDIRDYGEDAAAFGIEDTGTSFLWEDRYVSDVESMYDDLTVEMPD